MIPTYYLRYRVSSCSVRVLLTAGSCATPSLEVKPRRNKASGRVSFEKPGFSFGNTVSDGHLVNMDAIAVGEVVIEDSLRCLEASVFIEHFYVS